MQEKAAHRLLAQTLHQQMLEELQKNPELAADPDQQIQFKRLAQQQLLYQMALAAQGDNEEELGAPAAEVSERSACACLRSHLTHACVCRPHVHASLLPNTLTPRVYAPHLPNTFANHACLLHTCRIH